MRHEDDCPNKSRYCTFTEPCESCSLDAKERDSIQYDAARGAMADFDPEGFAMNGGHFSCRETDALFEMLNALDLPLLARALMLGHIDCEEDGDEHLGMSEEDVDVLITAATGKAPELWS